MATDDRFSVVDYVVFSVMLLISALIGIWYGCGPGGKQKTTAEYLLGDRQMKNWPVAISLLVSYLSAITILGLPGYGLALTCQDNYQVQFSFVA